MTLYRKTIFILALTYACLIVVIYAVTYHLLLKGVDDIEKVAVNYEVSQLDNVLSLDTNHMEGTTGDWAIWDDTYKFMDTGSKTYITSNLQDNSLISINVDIALFVKNSGEILFSKMINPKTKVGTTNLPIVVIKDLQNYKNILNLKGYKTIKKGLIQIDNNLMIFASRTVHKSDETGKSRGTLFFGRFVSDKFITDNLKTKMSGHVLLFPCHNPLNPLVVRKVDNMFDETGSSVYSLKTNETISCFRLVKDINGKPIFIFQIDLKRTVFQSVASILNYFSVFFVIFSVIFAILTVTLIKILVLNRFDKLNNLVNQVSNSNDTSLRVKIEGKDELSSLIDSVNKMLDKISYSSESLKAIYEGVIDGVAIVEKTSRAVLMINPILIELTGFEESQLIRKPVDVLFPNGHYTGSTTEYCRHFTFKSCFSKNVSSFKKNGELIYFDIASNTINYQGKSCLISFFRDVTSRKKIEDELEKNRYNLEIAVNNKTKELQESLKNVELANLSLVEANKHKTNFLSTMSHELRTPLNAIMGFSELLSRPSFGALTEKQGEFIKIIQSSSKHLLELINDILNLARIDSGKMELDIESVKQSEFINHIVNMTKIQLNKKNIEVVLDLQDENVSINADLRKVRQIMLNLLSNAIKYSPENNKIEIQSEIIENSCLKVSVTDHGIGIDKENIDNVFTEFYQVNRLRDEALGGTGIGLALTKRLVAMHGGEIGLKSEPGSYTTFWFTLPINNRSMAE